MKLYLSSFKLGNKSQKLVDFVGEDKTIAVISNALDFSTDLSRKQNSIQSELDSLRNINFNPEILDLKDYFNKKDELKTKMESYKSVWVRGGNAFVLRMAMLKSGFDEIIKSKIDDLDFVYAGYSAGSCVLSPTLNGLEIVDDPEQVETTYGEDVEWSGLGLIDFLYVPHYISDHPESKMVDDLVIYLDINHITYKTFSDGDVFIQG